MATLSPQQRSEIQGLLTQCIQVLKNEIECELRDSKHDHHVRLANEVHDRGEESFADLLDGISDITLEHHIKELKDYESALENINSRAFGCCADCGEEVGFDRLKAFPAAQRCVQCKTKLEDKQKMGGRG